MKKGLMTILTAALLLFACGEEEPILLVADGKTYESGTYLYDFGDVEYASPRSQSFEINVVNAEKATVTCASEYFSVKAAGDGDKLTVTVSNIPQTKSGIHQANVRITSAKGTGFYFGVTARQTDTVPNSSLEWPQSKTVAVDDLSFEAVSLQSLPSTQWTFADGAALTENSIGFVPEGGSVSAALPTAVSFGFFAVNIYAIGDSAAAFSLTSYDSEVGTVTVPIETAASQWTTVGLLVTSERIAVFNGDVLVREMSLKDASLDTLFPMTAFGVTVSTGSAFVESMVSYSENFAQENILTRFIADVRGKRLVFERVTGWPFSQMTQEEYDADFASSATAGKMTVTTLEFTPGTGLVRGNSNASISGVLDKLSGITWDTVHLTVEWESGSPNLYMHEGIGGDPHGFSFYKAGKAFIFDGEEGAWNGGGDDRTIAVSVSAGIPLNAGVYQDAKSGLMTGFIDFEPLEFSWKGAKKFSEYAGLTFNFNDTVMTVKDLAFFKSRVLTSAVSSSEAE